MRFLVKFIVFCVLAGVITWFIAPFDIKSLLKIPAAVLPSTFKMPGTATTPPTTSPSISAITRKSSPQSPPHLPTRLPASRPTSIRQVQDSTGLHWIVISFDGTLMRTDTTGSAISMSIAGGSAVPDAVPALRARGNAIRSVDAPASLTKDQLAQLRAIRVQISPSATKDDQATMQRPWLNYQTVQADANATADAKKNVETQLMQQLARIGQTEREAAIQRQRDAAAQILKILTPDQFTTLSSMKPTTRPKNR